MIYYSYEDFKHDVPALIEQMGTFRPDTVLAIARGGVTLGHALTMALGIRNLQCIRVESYDGMHHREEVTIKSGCDLADSRRVLIVDDIVDSGQTLSSLLPMLSRRYPGIEFRSASLFYKPTASARPDYTLHEARHWIDFFWESDFVLKTVSV
ncbi:MAG: phosphoribosyltransferase [Campylobacterota bacterium]